MATQKSGPGAEAGARSRRRLLAVSSGGGHWIQLQRLRPAFADFDTCYVSVFEDYADDVPGQRYRAVTDVTRRNAWKLILLAAQMLAIVLRERPHAVITTGAAPGLIAIAAARLLPGCRTVWIDSIANVERLSTSGRQARFFAHRWLTQWPALAQNGRPDHWGAVL